MTVQLIVDMLKTKIRVRAWTIMPLDTEMRERDGNAHMAQLHMLQPEKKIAKLLQEWKPPLRGVEAEEIACKIVRRQCFRG